MIIKNNPPKNNMFKNLWRKMTKYKEPKGVFFKIDLVGDNVGYISEASTNLIPIEKDKGVIWVEDFYLSVNSHEIPLLKECKLNWSQVPLHFINRLKRQSGPIKVDWQQIVGYLREK